MLLARNMPAAAPSKPVPPPVESAPAPAPRQLHDRHLFADYAWEWFESYKVPKLRPGTEMNYRLIIRKHLVPFFGSMRLDEITTVDVQRFYNQHAHQSRSTVNKLALILHGIFDSAIEDGLCVIDPTRSKRLTYSKKKTVREALSIEDAQDIICNLGKLELKDRLLVALLIFTGIRRGEALGLQWEDIDFNRKLINIRRSVRFAGNKGYIGPTKSKAGVRPIPLEPQLEEILTALPHGGKYILGNGEFPITEMTYKRGWERICRTINMHGATAHVLRHTYITMAAAHLDIKTLQTIAGHSDISTTMNRYAHGREDKIIQAGGLLRDMYG
jgi:integrase